MSVIFGSGGRRGCMINVGEDGLDLDRAVSLLG